MGNENYVRGFIDECLRQGLSEEEALNLIAQLGQGDRGACGGDRRLDGSGGGVGNRNKDTGEQDNE